MKFVALALALLLAVGSQAASLQADAPTQLQHVRSAVGLLLNKMKESAKNVLDQLDDTEYVELKTRLSQRLDDMHSQVVALQTSVSPMTDSVVSTIADATAGFRTSLMEDIEQLRKDIEPRREELKTVIDKHIDEYRKLMEPIITEYYTKHATMMSDLKLKLDPIIVELQSKVPTNVEETKTALMPIVEAVRDKLTATLESLKEAAAPYVEEYKDKLVQTYSQPPMSPEDLSALKEKITPLAEEIKANLQTIAESIAAAITKS